jgi:hypothetical protein
MLNPHAGRRFVMALAVTVLVAAPTFAQTTQTSTEKDQKDLAVTVYNSNVALVRDVRRLRLPAGTVRVYQGDSKGRVQFIGEDHIDHTPKDETLNLYIGNAFDVVAERKQTDYERLGPHAAEMAYEIALRNHKPEAITVLVNEPIGGEWTMVEANFKWEKTAAFTARFTVPVAADGESVLKYRMRVRW